MREYLGLLIRNWWFWIAIVTGILRVGEWVSGRQIPVLTPPIKTGLVLGLIFIAQHSAYRQKAMLAESQSATINDLQRQLGVERARVPAVDLTRPGFRGQLLTSALGDHHVFVDLLLINSGAPSIAVRWGVSVILRNSDTPIQLSTPPLDSTETLTMKGNGQDVPERIYKTEDMIWRKGQRPIPTGDYIRGWIFATSNIDSKLLNQFGNKILVTVQDSVGNEYILINETISENRYFTQ